MKACLKNRLSAAAGAVVLVLAVAGCEGAGRDSVEDTLGQDVATQETGALELTAETHVPDLAADVSTPDGMPPEDFVVVPPDVQADQPTLPPGCCETDQDCEGEQVCLAALAIPEEPSTCVPSPAAGQCYLDSDCAGGLTCIGAVVCPCTVVCDSPSQPGACMDIPAGCCDDQWDCGEGSICVPTPGADFPGVCMPEPDTGECYDDADCLDGQVCVDAYACPCNLDCFWSGPGTCQYVQAGCCLTDKDCENGMICVGQYPGGGAGACVPKPKEMECFTAQDCPANFFCLGGQECSCDMNCISEPGDCFPMPGDCCFLDSDCDEGYVCAESWGDSNPGVCEPAPLPGKCWNDEDCGGPFAYCQGASTCPCNADCDAPDMLGQCVCEPDSCCCPAAGCGPGMACVPVPGGQACKPIPEKGACWDDSQCGPDEACVGAIPCDCWWGGEGDGCDIPGTCIALPEGCCNVDGDCQPGLVCVGQEMGGTCQPAPEAGKCWDDEDCYETQECIGMTFCPCGMLCGVGTFPGKCSPLPGGCCYTDEDCPNDGSVCKGMWPGSNLPGSCVPNPLGPQCKGDAACCWDDADCPGESGCVGAVVCGCIELCWNCGACAPDEMGFCGI
jgi:hypothetical protein